jgi:hypothetical protein
MQEIHMEKSSQKNVSFAKLGFAVSGNLYNELMQWMDQPMATINCSKPIKYLADGTFMFSLKQTRMKTRYISLET